MPDDTPTPRFDESAIKEIISHLEHAPFKGARYLAQKCRDALEAHIALRERCLIAEMNLGQYARHIPVEKKVQLP